MRWRVVFLTKYRLTAKSFSASVNLELYGEG